MFNSTNDTFIPMGKAKNKAWTSDPEIASSPSVPDLPTRRCLVEQAAVLSKSRRILAGCGFGALNSRPPLCGAALQNAHESSHAHIVCTPLHDYHDHRVECRRQALEPGAALSHSDCRGSGNRFSRFGGAFARSPYCANRVQHIVLLL